MASRGRESLAADAIGALDVEAVGLVSTAGEVVPEVDAIGVPPAADGPTGATVTLGRRMVKESRAVPLAGQRAATSIRLPLTVMRRNSYVLLRFTLQLSGGPIGWSFSPPPPVTR